MPKKAPKVPCSTFIHTKALLAEAVMTADGPMFAVYDRVLGDVVYQKEFDMEAAGASVRYRPFDLAGGLHEFVKLPTRASEYGTESELFADIRAFIRRWVDLSERYEKIAALYVMFTWCHDEFFEIPYLRIIADLGSGKTRLGLQVLGAVAYKAFATIAASTLSPIFRTLDFVGGTMVLDEADLGEKSEKTSELVQLLNSGYVKDMRVMRSEKSGDGYIATRYKVFGPKIIISREHFKDAALESRCVELRIERTTRDDIPLCIDESLEEEAVTLRDRLLLWRMRTYGTHRAKIDRSFEKLDVPPRLRQLLTVLSGTVEDQGLVAVLAELGRELAAEHSERRGDTYEGDLIRALADRGHSTFITCQEIADAMNDGALPGDRKSPRSVSWYMRERLGLKPKLHPQTRRSGITLTSAELVALTKTYGIPYDPASEPSFTADALPP